MRLLAAIFGTILLLLALFMGGCSLFVLLNNIGRLQQVSLLIVPLLIAVGLGFAGWKLISRQDKFGGARQPNRQQGEAHLDMVAERHIRALKREEERRKNRDGDGST